MANEDVIDMAAGRIARCRCRRTDEQCYDCRLFAGLAAALREAREDTKRIDWLEMEMATEFEDGTYRSLFRQNLPITRESIDAAMKPLGGEGQ